MDEMDILTRIRDQKDMGEQNVETEKLRIEADIALIRGKKKKGSEELIGAQTTGNHVNALVARSYFLKSPIHIRPTTIGSERIAKAQNRAYLEDRDSPQMKALRYYKDLDKFSTGVSIIAKVGWDGKKKAPRWERINPLLAVPDPFGDYFLGDYRYIGFYSVRTEEEMKALGWDTSWCADSDRGKKEQIRKEQQKAGVIPQYDNTLFDIYMHFEKEVIDVEEGKEPIEKYRLYITDGDAKHLLAQKELDEMPFTFFYWKPNGTFFGDRIANYTRDTQKWTAEMRNLQADKVRQEVYTQWLYNSDYVSGKDIGFGLNKKIPIKSGLDGANIPLSNIVSPIQRDVRVDNTSQFIQELERELTLATSIGPVTQGSTPERREALGTNKLVQDNTDINLSLNEEMDAIGEQQFAILWYSAYRKHFKDADRKVVFAGSTTGQSPIILTKEDFIIEGNLSLEIETTQAKEDRQRKETAWRTQNTPLILQDPTINEASKRIVLRKALTAGGAEYCDLDEEVPMPAQYLLQLEENTILKETFIPINPDDDDEQHLVAMGEIDPENMNMVAHQALHIRAKIEKSKGQTMEQPNQMLNGAMSQAMSQAGSQVAKLNSNQ